MQPPVSREIMDSGLTIDQKLDEIKRSAENVTGQAIARFFDGQNYLYETMTQIINKMRAKILEQEQIINDLKRQLNPPTTAPEKKT